MFRVTGMRRTREGYLIARAHLHGEMVWVNNQYGSWQATLVAPNEAAARFDVPPRVAAELQQRARRFQRVEAAT